MSSLAPFRGAAWPSWEPVAYADGTVLGDFLSTLDYPHIQTSGGVIWIRPPSGGYRSMVFADPEHFFVTTSVEINFPAGRPNDEVWAGIFVGRVLNNVLIKLDSGVLTSNLAASTAISGPVEGDWIELRAVWYGLSYVQVWVDGQFQGVTSFASPPTDFTYIYPSVETVNFPCGITVNASVAGMFDSAPQFRNYRMSQVNLDLPT